MLNYRMDDFHMELFSMLMFFYLLYVIWLEMDGKELYKSSTKRPSLIQLQTKRSHHPCIPFRLKRV